MTGTRFMNHNMIPFENEVADYVKKTKKHVRYRVTPVFKGNDLVAQVSLWKLCQLKIMVRVLSTMYSYQIPKRNNYRL